MRPSLRSLALAALAASIALAPLLAASPAPAADAVTVPDVGGLIWQDAVTALTNAGLVARSAGDGVVVPDASTVADQCPRANASVAAGSTVTLSVR
ncbi:MAG TPA: PASTA domain-containing protein, partial [Gaiellaceae bacterium]|nr:PASTA domain-containing protein [Gaiellaceae bacterium]